MKKSFSAIVTILMIFFGLCLSSSGNVHAWAETDTPVHNMTIGGYTDDGEFNQPSRVYVDTSGNIYVADTSNYRIQKFNNAGIFQMKFGSYGTGDGQFAGPVGISADSGGSIYVVDMSNNRIQKFN